VIQESNTKAPSPCSCFRIFVGSSIVLLKERLLYVRDKLPAADLSAFPSVSQYRSQLMIVPVSMSTECTTSVLTFRTSCAYLCSQQTPVLMSTQFCP
jgi:hypothetical protein